MFKWRLLAIQNLTSTCMIGFYVQKAFLLHIGYIETVHINDQTILHFVNLWYKEVPINISYEIFINPIDRYLDARISPSYVR